MRSWLMCIASNHMMHIYYRHAATNLSQEARSALIAQVKLRPRLSAHSLRRVSAAILCVNALAVVIDLEQMIW